MNKYIDESSDQPHPMTVSRSAVVRIVVSLLLLLLLVSSVRPQAFQGYTFFGPNNSRNAYLVNMNNTVVKTWTFTKSGGYSAYLLKDGSVLRTAMSSGTSMNGGGAQGVVQKVAWDGTLTWEYTYSSSTYRSHHDICPMPNGNVLLIAWESKTAAQAVAAGLNHSSTIWPDHIVEVQPQGSTGGTIVWEWHAWDHLVQSYDAGKANYGVVKEHPELLNINVGSSGSGDWMHVNGLSYNEKLDQIVFSSHNLNELYVIDHSTTTAQAASHTGGRYGKGGDFLYRWGSPSNYGMTGTQVFDVVHCAIFVPDSLPGGGHIMAFNNRAKTGTSMLVELAPQQDSAGFYSYTAGTAYGPASPVWTYTAADFFAEHLGGIQRLPNGNTLAVESTTGYLREVDSTGKDVWTYNRGGEVVRALRYAPGYPGLAGLPTTVATEAIVPHTMSLAQNFPNPFNPSTTITFTLASAGPVRLSVTDIIGREVAVLVNGEGSPGEHSVVFDGSRLSSGVYLYRLQSSAGTVVKKMLLQK